MPDSNPSDLTTVINVKLWLPIPSTQTTEDATIQRLVTATSNDFMRATMRPDLLTDDYTEVREGDGSNHLILRHWPITEIASLTIGGVSVAASADKVAAGYYLDTDLDPERLWELFLAGYSFTDGATVQIGYSAGYETVPFDIEQAVIDWVVFRYKGRPTVGISSQQSGGRDGDKFKTQEVDIPLTTQSVIEKYTRKIPCLDQRAEKLLTRTKATVNIEGNVQ